MKNCVLKTLLILSIILSFSVKAAGAIPASAEQTARETGSVSTTDIKESEADIIKRKVSWRKRPITHLKQVI